jgi:hypothetical protein
VECCNLSLGLATKARAYEGVGQESSLGVTFHALESVRECEGMNPHTPKWAPILRVGVPMDSQIFRGRLQGSKLIGLKSPLYHWKSLGLRCLKWACMTHLGTYNTSYDQKKGRESNCQFDSQLLKLKNRPYSLVFMWCATCR